MVQRRVELENLRCLLSRHRVVGIVGARQVGKTTLARALVAQRKDCTIFDLENPEHLARLQDPMFTLKGLKGMVIIDEVQTVPGLFKVLRVLVDRPRTSVRFLVLGSASPRLLRQSAETLAGRITYHELGGFSLDEVGVVNTARLWLRGGFPRSYLARSNRASIEWRRQFVWTFLERDLPQLGVTIQTASLRRFWTMLAHYHGQIWNASEFARSFGVADTTIRGYLDVLTSAMVIRQLPPWHENVSKRQVKAPKVFIADSGVLHALLNLTSLDDVENHPKVGASWEGFAIGEIIRRLGARRGESYFWATHGGASLDLFVIRGRQRLGFEIKRTSSPTLTKSMRVAVKDLSLQRLDVVHAGDETFPISKTVRAVALRRLLDDLAPLR